VIVTISHVTCEIHQAHVRNESWHANAKSFAMSTRVMTQDKLSASFLRAFQSVTSLVKYIWHTYEMSHATRMKWVMAHEWHEHTRVMTEAQLSASYWERFNQSRHWWNTSGARTNCVMAHEWNAHTCNDPSQTICKLLRAYQYVTSYTNCIMAHIWNKSLHTSEMGTRVMTEDKLSTSYWERIMSHVPYKMRHATHIRLKKSHCTPTKWARV